MKFRMIVVDGKKVRLNRFIDWLVYMVGYTFILILITIIFNDTFILDNSYFGFGPLS